MNIEKLSKKDKIIVDELFKVFKYKSVSRCKKCKEIFGHDTKEESLCIKCDPGTPKKLKERLERLG